MAQLLNRAGWRDDIRRQLQIPTALDDPTIIGPGVPGEPAQGFPNPSNAVLNDVIDRAIASVNKYSGFYAQQYDLPATAAPQGVTGPSYLPLYGLLNAPQDSSLISVRSARWIGSDTASCQLQVQNYQEWDRQQYFWQLVQPATPQYYWIVGYQFVLFPWPVIDGMVEIVGGGGVPNFQSDGDTLSALPADLQVGIRDVAVYLYSLQQTMDAEARERAQNYLPLAQDARVGIKAWLVGDVQQERQITVAPLTYRTAYGYRKIRR